MEQQVHRDWIKQQLGKGISAEQSVIKAEKDHKDRLKGKAKEFVGVYDSIIRDDEKHLDEMKRVASKYGYEAKGTSESGGGILGGLKSLAEGITTSDPFQTIGDDLMLKSNAVNYDQTWSRIFRDLGDEDSANAMEIAAREDEQHQSMLRDTMTSVGLMEAHGEELEEE